MKAVERALEFVTPGCVIGLGTGRAATAFIEELGRRVQAGLSIRGVPTSKASAALANSLGISLTTLADVAELDLAVDGADEVDPQCNLIKGYGGALIREKIVAASARRFVVLVGPEKLVPQLGSRGRLPLEVVPFAEPFVTRQLQRRGVNCQVRTAGGAPVFSDNANLILDVNIGAFPDPSAFEMELLQLPGVVGTGLFLNMADVVLVDGDPATEMMPTRN